MGDSAALKPAEVSMRKQQTGPSAQLGLPGIDLAQAPTGQHDRSRRPAARKKARSADEDLLLGSPGVLNLPPVASFSSMSALLEAICQLETYLAALRRRRGNQLGWQESARVRASKRPSKSGLALVIGPLDAKGRPEQGAISAAAAHFRVDRRTISQWRRDDTEA